MAKVTKRTVDALKPMPGRDQLLWDDELPGFGARCRPNGSKVYFLKYRTAGGRQRWLTLGRHGPMTPDQARRKALHEKAAISDGADPSGERQTRRREHTIADLWDRYSKEVVAIENKPRTAAEKTRMWRRRIKPKIGHLKISEVTEEDTGAVVRTPLRLDDVGQIIGGKAAAGNLYRLLHHMFHKALQWKLRSKDLGNPLEGVTEPKVKPRERLLSGGEIGALMKALDAAEAEGTEHLQTVAVIRAAILTGARISELLKLRWREIRREEIELHLPDTKTGFSRRPISAAALAVFDGVERMPGIEFVFRAVNTPAEPLPYNTVEKVFRRIAGQAGIERCTLHTLRHWFATMTANSVNNARVGMALTGHKSHAAYMNYIHGDKEQAAALAEQLAELANGLAKADSNVAEIAKTAAAK